MTDDVLKLAKVIELALAASAADGLEDSEVQIFFDKLLAVAQVGEHFNRMAASDNLTDEELDLAQLPNAFQMLKEVSHDDILKGELSEDYLKETCDIIGDGLVLNNLCFALCIVMCSGDGEISELESERLDRILSSLVNVNSELSQELATQILQAEVPTWDEISEDPELYS